MAAGAVRWAALTGIYLALSGEMATAEIVAGLLAGLLCAAVSLGLRATAARRFRLRAPWHRLLARGSISIVRDTARVAGALVRALPAGAAGIFVRQPFAGGGEGQQPAGRRALATLLASVAPNGYVTRAGAAALELHRLQPAPAAPDREWPV